MTAGTFSIHRCSVSAIRTLRKLGEKAVMVNYNPETVSTDYDECDRLYFEEISLERVLDIYEVEGCKQAIVSVGGQIPNGIAMNMGDAAIDVAGTSPKMIDTAEDRNKFSDLMDEVGIDQPEWQMLTSLESAHEFSSKVGFPVLVRPSYVLSGAAMNVAYSSEELDGYLQGAAEVSGEHPVVVSKFVEGAREIDVDAVAQQGRVLLHTVAEHVENAGVHSGDATQLLPPQTIGKAALAKVDEITFKMAKALQITGPFNMQLIVKGDTVKVIECNLRASRSFPFSSKCMGVNFIDVATRAMVQPNEQLPETIGGRTTPIGDFIGVKSPMFSFQRLKGADPSLGVEMSSTGEVACFGKDKHVAFLNSLVSTGLKLPRENILVSVQERERNEKTLPVFKKLTALGYKLFATDKTSEFLAEGGVPCTKLAYAGEVDAGSPDACIDDFISRGSIHMVRDHG
jgi:carbamoyl-phosphate synthase large subunit